MGKWVKVTKNRSHPARVVATENQLHAIELRKDGLNYDQIAEVLKISRQGAWQLVNDGLKNYRRVTAEAVEEVRELEVQRLDRLLMGHWEKAMSGDDKSAGVVLKIMERRSRLLGLDTPPPSRVEVTGKDGGAIDHNVTLADLVAKAYEQPMKEIVVSEPEVKDDS